jgi:ribosomal subunit interface protein
LRWIVFDRDQARQWRTCYAFGGGRRRSAGPKLGASGGTIGLRMKKEKTMQIPLQISFRNMDPSPAVEAIVREKAAKLDRFFERIVSCEVTVEAPHRRQHKGKLYRVRIDIGMPGKDVHVNQEGPKNQAHQDVYVAIRDAFDAAVRQVEDQAQRLRGDVKSHAS